MQSCQGNPHRKVTGSVCVCMSVPKDLCYTLQFSFLGPGKIITILGELSPTTKEKSTPKHFLNLFLNVI